MNAATPDRLLRLADVITRVGVCRAEVYKLIQAGRFPKIVKIGSSARWSEREVSEWIESRKAARDAR